MGRGSAGRLVTLAGAITRAVGPPAALRAVPAFLAVGIAAAIAFSPSGMRAEDLTAAARASIGVRAGLWAGWLLIVTPVARVLLEHPTALYLRALPAERWHFGVVHAAHLLIAQLPWTVLWARGQGAATAVAATLGGAAAAALVVARPARAIEVAAAAALGGALLAGAPAPLLGACAIGAGAIGIGAAWERAPLGGRRHRARRDGSTAIRSMIRRPPALALALAHLQVLWRGEGPVVHRSAVAALLGSLILAVAARNNEILGPEELGELTLAVGALPLTVAAAGLAGPVLGAEKRIGWLLDVTATGPASRAHAATAATAAGGLAAGGLYAGCAALLLEGVGPAALARVGVVGIGTGAALGALAAAWARRADRPLGVDGGTLVAAMTGTALAALVLTLLLGAWALLPLALVALWLALASTRVAAVAMEAR